MFKDCEYRRITDNKYICKNKTDNGECDNCKENIHLNCENYNPVKDFCLKYFQGNISEINNECREKTIANDKELSRKWSNWNWGLRISYFYSIIAVLVVIRKTKIPGFL